jgi:uncharacterized FlaG/YvyC family protein
MATISKIAGPADLLTQTMPRQADRTSPSEAGSTTGIERPDIFQPQGVKQALKAQQENKLPGSSFSLEDLSAMVSRMQEALDRAAREQYEVGFRKDSQANSYVIEIKNREGELVKQFPPEKVLNLQRKMDELSGMVIDEMT